MKFFFFYLPARGITMCTALSQWPATGPILFPCRSGPDSSEPWWEGEELHGGGRTALSGVPAVPRGRHILLLSFVIPLAMLGQFTYFLHPNYCLCELEVHLCITITSMTPFIMFTLYTLPTTLWMDNSVQGWSNLWCWPKHQVFMFVAWRLSGPAR